jgi:hypothetical protein
MNIKEYKLIREIKTGMSMKGLYPPDLNDIYISKDNILFVNLLDSEDTKAFIIKAWDIKGNNLLLTKIKDKYASYYLFFAYADLEKIIYNASGTFKIFDIKNDAILSLNKENINSYFIDDKKFLAFFNKIYKKKNYAYYSIIGLTNNDILVINNYPEENYIKYFDIESEKYILKIPIKQECRAVSASSDGLKLIISCFDSEKMAYNNYLAYLNIKEAIKITYKIF